MTAIDGYWPILVQVSAFFPKSAPITSPKLVAEVMSSFPRKYDGSIESIPIPDFVDLDVPRATLRSADRAWTISSSRYWIRSSWGHTIALPRTGDIQDLALECCQPIAGFLTNNPETKAGRLGLLVRRVKETETPARVLAERFCKAECVDQGSLTAPLKHSRGFQIHNHKQYEHPELRTTLNSWMRCKSANLKTTGEEVIEVEQDINTLAENLTTATYGADCTLRFTTIACMEANEVMRLYFESSW